MKVCGFQGLLVQCLITITGDGCVSIRPSSAAGERKADYPSQQRTGQHCGNSRQIEAYFEKGKREQDKGLFEL